MDYLFAFLFVLAALLMLALAVGRKDRSDGGSGDRPRSS
jgi:hypothetical protein